MKIHEVQAANQHWVIGMGCYLEQLARGTLPTGEIPYIFSNKYSANQMEISDGCGYLNFNVGWDRYDIQISGTKGMTNLMVNKGFDKCIKYLIVIDNSILDPWLNRIQRGW